MSGGIGTYKESSLHAALKHYLEPDAERHEQPFGGSVVDILDETGAIEIQTRSFRALRKKLERLLPQTRITVVYPVAERKRIYWTDPATGETTGGRLSPRRGDFYDVWRELPALWDLLDGDRLSLRVLRVELDEYKVLDGFGPDKKRRATRTDRVLRRVTGELRVACPADFRNLIPPGLPEPFGARDFARAARLNVSVSQSALRTLFLLGLVRRVGRTKAGYAYELAQTPPAHP